MNTEHTYISYRETNSFSKVVVDYVNEEKQLMEFIQDFPSIEAIKKQLERKQFNAKSREILCNVLNEYYKNIEASNETKTNIDLLPHESTFTICTAHQPSLLTGHLYFIYKIIHAIKLAMECKSLFPAYNFVPIFYMGSEDNDLDEIGAFHYHDKNYHWHTSQTGACGRMRTTEMEQMIQEVRTTLNEANDDEATLSSILVQAYNGENTLAQATSVLVNALFDKYGLVIVDADDKCLKQLFSEVMKEELLQQSSQALVQETLDAINKHYKIQANPREINLFYLKGNLRERIEKNGDTWHVVNTEIKFSREEIIEELHNHPDRFSPNVILRPLYQETILPNIAFVGGGGELAYWLELKKLFQHHNITYPILFLRNSVLWLNEKTAALIDKMNLSNQQLFLKKDLLFKELLQQHDVMQKVEAQVTLIQQNFDELKKLSAHVSSSLERSMHAHNAKAKRIEDRIKQKYIAALKQKETLLFQRIESIQHMVSPNATLQERHNNFLSIFKVHGFRMLDILLQHQEAFGKEFLILKDKQ